MRICTTLLLCSWFMFRCDRDFKNPVDLEVSLPIPGEIQFNQVGEWIQLSWSINQRYKSGYLIERKSGNNPFSAMALITDVNQTGYMDTTSQTDLLYQYRMCGLADENKTPYSEAQSFKSTFPVPSNLTMTPMSDSSLRLNWQDNSSFEDGFSIERKRQDETNWVVVGQTARDQAFFIDQGLLYNFNYLYRIEAFTRHNKSAYSDLFSTVILIAAPTNLTSTPLNDHQIRLTWKDHSEIESGFKIERMENNNFLWHLVGLVSANVTSFTDDSLKLNTVYSYQVRAIGGTYESALSNSTTNQTFFPGPSNLSLDSFSEYSVDLSWQDNCAFEEGYLVKYVQQDQSDTMSFQLVAGATNYTLDDINKEFVYSIWVFALTSFNQSEAISAQISYSDNFVHSKQLHSHSNKVISLDFSADSKLLAAGDEINEVYVWDTSTWSEMQMLQGDTSIHHGGVTSLSFARSYPWLAMGNMNGSVRVVNSNDWSEITNLYLNAYILFDCQFSVADVYLAASKYKYIYVWSTDIWSYYKTLSGHTDEIHCIDFSANGSWIASGGRDDVIKIWSTQSWSTLQTLTGHTDDLNVLCFSPNSQWLASAGKDKVIKIWSTDDWLNFDTLIGHEQSVAMLDFSGDGKWLASAGEDSREIKIWSVQTWQQIDQIQDIDVEIYALKISPDGHWLAAGDAEGVVNIWELQGAWQLRALDSGGKK